MNEPTSVLRPDDAASSGLRRLPAEMPNFSFFVRTVATDRFTYISGSKDFAVTENPKWDDFCYGSHLAVILIAGKDFKIFFKAHFRANKYALAMAPDKDRAAVYDVFREYCNLTAGAIKKGLQQPNVISGISLPSVTSGYDELIFSDTIRKDRIVDCFDIKGPKFQFTITTTLDTANADMFAKLDSIKPESAEEEEIEFL